MDRFEQHEALAVVEDAVVNGKIYEARVAVACPDAEQRSFGVGLRQHFRKVSITSS